MNRRDFVSRVTLGAAAACTGIGSNASAAPSSHLKVRFVGMMTFLERTDKSFLVATPGHHAFHHMTHTPFLMARAGSAIAKDLGFEPVRGVNPEAFDTVLAGSRSQDFVYKNLDNTSLEIVTGSTDAVDNHATEMALMNKIAPGKRVRGNVEKWASSTISLRGGRIDNSHGHPDAGKIWAFGEYKQRLTDAVNFTSNGPTTIRLTSANQARTFTVPADGTELWVFSAAQPDAAFGQPTMLEHSQVLFDYLVDAKAIVPTCPSATGRDVPATELPYVGATSASVGITGAATTMPPLTELCFIASLLLG
jgi:hypothetical protein